MAASSSEKFTIGRGAEVAFIAPGLLQFLKEASQASDQFNGEMRKAAQQVAQIVVDRAKVNANQQAPHGNVREGSSGHSQASQVVRGLRARSDRIPTIKLDGKRGYVSASRPNRKRRQQVTMGQVFFGAEFGGRRTKKTQQFLRHRGRSGYFFWHAVRESKGTIATEYLAAIDTVLKKLAPGAD